MNWPKTNRNGSSTQGFTRTDLLACVAVTVLLSGLAASGLSSPKDNVSRMTCARNMRQIALAISMYACDNQDYIPYSNGDGGMPLGSEHPGWLYTLPVPSTLIGAGQTVIPDPLAAPWNTNGATGVSELPASAWESGLLFAYVQSPAAYLCPTDIQSPSWAAEPGSPVGPGRNNKLSSYVMNNCASGLFVYRVSDIWSPDCYLFWEVDENGEGPNNPGPFAFDDGGNWPDEYLGVLHGNNGGEVVTVGGNVNFVTLSAFKYQANNPGSGPGGLSLAWWAPLLTHGGQ
jgi:hypothetical protein